MARKTLLISALLVAFAFQGHSQTLDRPQYNFYYVQAGKAIEYRKVFEVPDSTKAIKKKLKTLLSAAPDMFLNVQYDGDSCTGTLKNVRPEYYTGSKELEGEFKVEVKSGKYRVIIKDMTLHGSIFNSDLEEVVINDGDKEWKSEMVYNLLTDLDGDFSKVFTIGSTGSDW